MGNIPDSKYLTIKKICDGVELCSFNSRFLFRVEIPGKVPSYTPFYTFTDNDGVNEFIYALYNFLGVVDPTKTTKELWETALESIPRLGKVSHLSSDQQFHKLDSDDEGIDGEEVISLVSFVLSPGTSQVQTCQGEDVVVYDTLANREKLKLT